MLDRPTIAECWESCRSLSWRLKTSFNARGNTCMDSKTRKGGRRGEKYFISRAICDRWRALIFVPFCRVFLEKYVYRECIPRLITPDSRKWTMPTFRSRPSREMHFFPYRGSLKEWAFREIRLDLNFDASSALKSRVIACLEAEEENVRKAGNCPILFVPPYKPRFTTARTLLFSPPPPYFSTFNFGVNWPKPWTGNGCVSLLSG